MYRYIRKHYLNFWHQYRRKCSDPVQMINLLYHLGYTSQEKWEGAQDEVTLQIGKKTVLPSTFHQHIKLKKIAGPKVLIGIICWVIYWLSDFTINYTTYTKKTIEDLKVNYDFFGNIFDNDLNIGMDLL